MKIPAPKGVITVKGDQQEARKIEQGFSPGLANIHNLETIVDNPKFENTKTEGCKNRKKP